MITAQIREFYVAHSLTSDPGRRRMLLDDLPATIDALVDATGGLLIHVQTAHDRYGEPEPPDFGAGELTMSRLLEQLTAISPGSLADARPPEKRLRINCGRFALFFLSVLRHHGIPTRKRAGFGWNGWIHEIVEYWDDDRNRWVLIDPDPTVRPAIRDHLKRVRGIDPGGSDADLIRPGEAFTPGSLAWRECRAGGDPARFHVVDHEAMSGIRVALLQDLDSMNKTELRTHDEWHDLMTKDFAELRDEELRWLDAAADLIEAGDGRFGELRAFYDQSAYAAAVRSRLSRTLAGRS